MNIQKATTAPTSPGIYAGLSNADYHAGPGISKSGLDLLARSPLHYWDRYRNPNPPPREETDAMRFGTAVHTAILEPEDFSRWVVWQRISKATKEGKASWAEAEALAKSRGVPVIDSEAYEVVRKIACQVLANPVVGPRLETGVPELSVYWVDEETGVFCRCRPDWLGVDAVIDLKTTTDASPRSFVNSAYTYRYWVQAAFYLDGLAANGVNMYEFLFAAIEKTSPYAVMTYPAHANFIAAGRFEYKRLLRLYSECLMKNEWPAYGDGMDLILPAWAPERMFSDNTFATTSELE